MSFDRVARSYRWMELLAFGGALQRARVAALAEARGAKRALIVGEGDGRFLRELLRVNPDVQVDCADESAAMLALASARVPADDAARVRYIRCDVTAWEPERRDYDLVVTHFVLDLFDAAVLRGVVHKLARASTDDATWLLADFTLPERALPRLRAHLWLALLYLFFRVTTGLRTRALVDPAPLLAAEGYALTRKVRTRLGLLMSTCWRRTQAQVDLQHPRH